jgi:hypothetical protein
LTYYADLTAELRAAIRDGRLREFALREGGRD